MDAKDLLEAKMLIGGHDKGQYSSKAVGGTALGLGIGALALNLFRNGGFPLFGGFGYGEGGQHIHLQLLDKIHNADVNALSLSKNDREKDLQEKAALLEKITTIAGDIRELKAITPYIDELTRLRINNALIEAKTHTNHVTRHMINGRLVLPTTPTVTGIPASATNEGGCCDYDRIQTMIYDTVNGVSAA